MSTRQHRLTEQIRSARQQLAALDRQQRQLIDEDGRTNRIQPGDVVEYRRDGVGVFQAEVLALDPSKKRSVKLRYLSAGARRRQVDRPPVWISPARIKRVLAYASSCTALPPSSKALTS